MVSEFLKSRYETFAREVGGSQTVGYFVFVEGTPDPLTGDVTEATAYRTGVYLPALIDMSPSRAMREKVGMEIDFEATVRIVKAHAAAAAIVPKIGDALTLMQQTVRYYVKQIIEDRQAGAEMLDYVLAVSRKVGRRG